MSTVVVYSSQTGFTKRYAEWLAEELGCQVVSLGDEPRFDASGFDVVVLGGWLHCPTSTSRTRTCWGTTATPSWRAQDMQTR